MKETTPRQEIIKATFGNKYRLDVWDAVSQFSIEPPEPFYAPQIVKELKKHGAVESSIWREIKNLERLGAIEIAPDQVDMRTLKYYRLESPLWDIARVGLQAVNQMSQNQQRPIE